MSTVEQQIVDQVKKLITSNNNLWVRLKALENKVTGIQSEYKPSTNNNTTAQATAQ